MLHCNQIQHTTSSGQTLRPILTITSTHRSAGRDSFMGTPHTAPYAVYEQKKEQTCLSTNNNTLVALNFGWAVIMLSH